MIWNLQTLKRIDFRLLPLIFALMVISILVISSTTGERTDIYLDQQFFTPHVKKQIVRFLIGWGLFFFFSGFDYHQLRNFTWLFYVGAVLLLLGLYFAPTIQNVHRWYRFGGFTFQPSEYAKLIVIMALAWFLEYKAGSTRRLSTALQALLIMLIPFGLILKQPDLGTAIILYPVALAMFYFGGIQKRVVGSMTALAGIGCVVVSLLFTGIVPHESMRPYATKFLKDYQFDRLNPDTYHQKAALTAIALGGLTGTGWGKSEFTGHQWLPTAHTDSVFPAFAEQYGFLGTLFLLGIFFGFIYVSFQVIAVAKDRYGRLLSAGIAVYLAVHILINLGMMCGFLPITGEPLILISYGGSSIQTTMTALGILQNIYSQRFTFS